VNSISSFSGAAADLRATCDRQAARPREALDAQVAFAARDQARQAHGRLLLARLQLGRHGAESGADVAGDEE
jgi:hypothetical protein